MEVGNCFPKKITVDVLDNQVEDNIKGFYFSTFYEFLAASNAMVANLPPSSLLVIKCPPWR
jgi:hypothetical protein